MKILLAVDDSPYSEEAARTLIARPWPRGTVVRVLTAVGKFTPPAAELWFDAGGDLEYARKIVRERAEYTTERAAEMLRPCGFSIETAVRDGDPRSVIVDEAKEWSADLIIVGSHGYTGIKQWLLGSVAQAVVSNAPCSVEVVRRKQTDESHEG